MLIPKKNHVEVYKYLFKEGVLYAKDYNASKHPEIDVPNLQVIKLMQSSKSKEYVKESFAWRHHYWHCWHYYWYLIHDGIEHLSTYLNLPSEIVSATLKKSARPSTRPIGQPRDDLLDPAREETGPGLAIGKYIEVELLEEHPGVGSRGSDKGGPPGGLGVVLPTPLLPSR